MGEEPRHLCASCNRIVRGRCPVCRRRRELARPSARARGYDPAWEEYSKRWLARFPWCGQRLDGQLHPEHSRCVQEGRRERAAVTDHMRSMALGGSKWQPRNHQSLCRGCNARKGIRLEGGFGHPVRRTHMADTPTPQKPPQPNPNPQAPPPVEPPPDDDDDKRDLPGATRR